MRNIYKSQKYQFFRDVKMYLFIFAVIAVMIFTYIQEMNYYSKDMLCGSLIFINSHVTASNIFFFIIIFAPYMMGKDLSNKTMLSELSSGNLRRNVFWARALLTIRNTLFCSIVFLFLPGAIATIVYGYGSYILFSTYLFRVLIYVCAIFKTICEMILAVMVTKKISESIAVGVFLYMIGLFPQLFNIIKNPLLLDYTAGNIFEFTLWISHHLHSVDYLYTSVLPTNDGIIKIVYTLAIGIMCLIVAQRIFEVTDVDIS